MPANEPEKSQLKYRRVLLKLSGEALMGPGQFGIDIPTCITFAEAIARFQARDFAAAARGFAALEAQDPVAGLFAARAARYAAEPPPDDWTGILVLDAK
jgi:hypothetical protein